MDRMELADAYREIICENIEYSILAERHGKQRMDETVELMLEVVLSKRPYIRIAGDDFPRKVVRSRFLKINSSHVEYVFGCIDNMAYLPYAECRKQIEDLQWINLKWNFILKIMGKNQPKILFLVWILKCGQKSWE